MKKNPKCPKCNSKNTRYIVYGNTSFGIDYEKLHDRKISFGGCCITDESPKWECFDCKNKWDYHLERNETYYKIQKQSFESFCKRFDLKEDFLVNETNIHVLSDIVKTARKNNLSRITHRVSARILELDPKNIEALISNSKSLYLLERYDESQDHMNKVVEIEPNNPQNWYERGDLLLKLGNFEEALECFDKATRIDQNYIDAWLGMGIALMELSLNSDAIRSFDIILSLNPNHLDALNNKGTALDKLGDKNNALACFNQVLMVDPDNSSAKVGKIML